jgi:hypothetical protein
MEDASLDEFLGGDTGEEDDAATEENAGATARDEGSSETEFEAPDSAEDEAIAATKPTSRTTEVEPARSTMVFAPDGAPCETCEAVVQRRWRAEDGLYCANCLEW